MATGNGEAGLMRYRERRVDPPLDRFVECVWFLSTPPDEPVAAPLQTILPDGCIEAIFHLGERFQSVERDAAAGAQPAWLVAGMLTSPLRVAAVAGAESVGIRFRPGGAYPFFDVPLSELTDCLTPLDALWRGAASHLADRLHEAAGDDARVALISEALRTRLARLRVDDGVDAAVCDLIRSAGRMSVRAVADRASMTTRHLQRRFTNRVGVSPKMLARILRFQNTLRRRAEPHASGWLDVAIDCGYTDQSHLIHDYAAFAGETPASLRAAEGELSAHFTAPQRLAALFAARR